MKRFLTTLAAGSTVAALGFGGFALAEDAPSTQPANGGGMSCCPMGGMSGMGGMRGRMMPMADDAEHAEKVQPIRLDEEQQQRVDAMTTAYLAVQQKLADDTLEGVAEQMEIVHSRAHALAETENERLKELVTAVSNAAHVEGEGPADLAAAREAFKPVSKAMIALTRAAAPSDEAAETLRVAHCPMAKASWLQTGEEVVNPYMGQKMLRCGEFTRIVKGEKKDEADGHDH